MSHGPPHPYPLIKFHTSPGTIASPSSNLVFPTDEFHSLINKLSQILGTSSGITSASINPLVLQELMRSYVSCEEHWKDYAFSDPGKSYARNLVEEGNGSANLLILVYNPHQPTPITDHASIHCIMKVLSGTLKQTRYQHPNRSKPTHQILNSIWSSTFSGVSSSTPTGSSRDISNANSFTSAVSNSSTSMANSDSSPLPSGGGSDVNSDVEERIASTSVGGEKEKGKEEEMGKAQEPKETQSDGSTSRRKRATRRSNSFYRRKGTALKVVGEKYYERDDVIYMDRNVGLYQFENVSGEVAVSLCLFTPPNPARLANNIFYEHTGRRSYFVHGNDYQSRFGRKCEPVQMRTFNHQVGLLEQILLSSTVEEKANREQGFLPLSHEGGI